MAQHLLLVAVLVSVASAYPPQYRYYQNYNPVEEFVQPYIWKFNPSVIGGKNNFPMRTEFEPNQNFQPAYQNPINPPAVVVRKSVSKNPHVSFDIAKLSQPFSESDIADIPILASPSLLLPGVGYPSRNDLNNEDKKDEQRNQAIGSNFLQNEAADILEKEQAGESMPPSDSEVAEANPAIPIRHNTIPISVTITDIISPAKVSSTGHVEISQKTEGISSSINSNPSQISISDTNIPAAIAPISETSGSLDEVAAPAIDQELSVPAAIAPVSETGGNFVQVASQDISLKEAEIMPASIYPVIAPVKSDAVQPSEIQESTGVSDSSGGPIQEEQDEEEDGSEETDQAYSALAFSAPNYREDIYSNNNFNIEDTFDPAFNLFNVRRTRPISIEPRPNEFIGASESERPTFYGTESNNEVSVIISARNTEENANTDPNASETSASNSDVVIDTNDPQNGEQVIEVAVAEEQESMAAQEEITPEEMTGMEEPSPNEITGMEEPSPSEITGMEEPSPSEITEILPQVPELEGEQLKQLIAALDTDPGVQAAKYNFMAVWNNEAARNGLNILRVGNVFPETEYVYMPAIESYTQYIQSSPAVRIFYNQLLKVWEDAKKKYLSDAGGAVDAEESVPSVVDAVDSVPSVVDGVSAVETSPSEAEPSTNEDSAVVIDTLSQRLPSIGSVGASNSYERLPQQYNEFYNFLAALSAAQNPFNVQQQYQQGVIPQQFAPGFSQLQLGGQLGNPFLNPGQLFKPPSPKPSPFSPGTTFPISNAILNSAIPSSASNVQSGKPLSPAIRTFPNKR